VVRPSRHLLNCIFCAYRHLPTSVSGRLRWSRNGVFSRRACHVSPPPHCTTTTWWSLLAFFFWWSDPAPAGVYVRGFGSRMDLLKVLIIGSSGTPCVSSTYLQCARV
jgi:hypothetical protein